MRSLRLPGRPVQIEQLFDRDRIAKETATDRAGRAVGSGWQRLGASGTALSAEASASFQAEAAGCAFAASKQAEHLSVAMTNEDERTCRSMSGSCWKPCLEGRHCEPPPHDAITPFNQADQSNLHVVMP
jgi:hypothetical protein